MYIIWIKMPSWKRDLEFLTCCVKKYFFFSLFILIFILLFLIFIYFFALKPSMQGECTTPYIKECCVYYYTLMFSCKRDHVTLRDQSQNDRQALFIYLFWVFLVSVLINLLRYQWLKPDQHCDKPFRFEIVDTASDSFSVFFFCPLPSRIRFLRFKQTSWYLHWPFGSRCLTSWMCKHKWVCGFTFVHTLCYVKGLNSCVLCYYSKLISDSMVW